MMVFASFCSYILPFVMQKKHVHSNLHHWRLNKVTRNGRKKTIKDCLATKKNNKQTVISSSSQCVLLFLSFHNVYIFFCTPLIGKQFDKYFTIHDIEAQTYYKVSCFITWIYSVNTEQKNNVSTHGIALWNILCGDTHS